MPPASPQRPAPAGPPPLPRAAVIDRYFLEHRAKLIDLAAFLDRVDRAEPGDSAEPDPRLAALRRAIGVLAEPDPGRAARVLRLLSDPTDRPIDSAAGPAIWPRVLAAWPRVRGSSWSSSPSAALSWR